MKKSEWEVAKYGIIIDDYDIKIDGNYIRQKIYKYEDTLYIDTWCNGIKLSFNEVI